MTRILDKMKKRSRNEENRRSYLSIVVGLLAMFLLGLIYASMKRTDVGEIKLQQDQHYDVNVNGEVFNDVDLREFTFPDMHKGELLIYSTKLQGHLEAPVIRLFVAHSSVRVFLDGELLYEYGQKPQHMYGYGYLTVPLPSDYEGRTLTVAQTVQEDGEIRKIRIPSICNADRFNDGIIGDKRIQLVVCCSVILLSATVIVVGFLFIRRNPKIRNLIWMAISFIFIALWSFGISNLIELFAGNHLALKGYVEYFSLYAAPVFFSMYFADDFYYNYEGKNRYIFPVLIAVEVAFPIIALFLHFLDIVHLPKVLLVGHILIVTTLIYVLTMSVIRVKKRQGIYKQGIHKEMLVGTVLLVIVSMIEFGRYLYYKYVNVQNSDFESIVLIGLYIFALSVIIDFFNSQQRTMLAEAKNEVLEKLAYEDIMTGVYNRQKINDLEREIVKNPRPFGIVNFDLNDLKKANDQYGHAEGDKLITDFADLLQSVFSKDGVVARMGGDEFIVVYPELGAVDHEKLMQQLRQACDKKNRDRGGVQISFAAGYACVGEEELGKMRQQGENETGRLFREMYKRADEKMYENKAKVKAGK